MIQWIVSAIDRTGCFDASPRPDSAEGAFSNRRMRCIRPIGAGPQRGPRLRINGERRPGVGLPLGLRVDP